MIAEFKGEMRWLSNFQASAIDYLGNTYPTVEHAYQAQKSPGSDWDARCQLFFVSAKDIKKESKNIKPPEDWFEHNIELMRTLVRLKFQIPDLRDKLLATGDEELQEGNTWNDTFWGVDLTTGVGENWLGKILMEVRNECR